MILINSPENYDNTSDSCCEQGGMMKEQGEKLFDADFQGQIQIKSDSVKKKIDKPEFALNPKLLQYLEKYIRSYSDRGKEIEIKGRLIDFIRRVH